MVPYIAGPRGGSMETVSATTEFTGAIHEMVDRCRTLQSRGDCWPGALPRMAVGNRLVYGVSMRLKAATMTDIEIDETVDEPEESDDGSIRLRTIQRVTWPDGHEDAMTEYLSPPEPRTTACTSATPTGRPARSSSSRKSGRTSTTPWSGWPSATSPT